MFFSSWLRNPKRTRAAKIRPHRKASLRLEVLEDRLCPSATEAFANLPLAFEANVGQTDAHVDFVSRGAGYATFLTPSEAVLSLASGTANDVVRLQVLGGNPNAPVAGLDELPGSTNYLFGNDPSQWHTDVTNYGKVFYDDVYAGIDLVYYGNQRNLEYDFVLAPGADPGVIRLNFDGAKRLSLDGAGNLVLKLPGDDLIQHAPVVYQEIGGVRQSVAGSYRLLGGGQVGFNVGAHDASRPLVIDPVLSYSSYFGGSTTDYAFGIAVDAAGNAYVTGYTFSSNFPTLNPLQSQRSAPDLFVTKLNAAGTALAYSTYLGGSSADYGYGIAVDSSGNASVTGLTSSSDFPMKNALQGTYGGNSDAFAATLNATGSALLYSTYLGGSNSESTNGYGGGGIAVDGSGLLYVTGTTGSTNFPTTPGALQTSIGSTDAFVTKLDPTKAGAASLIYSTYLGGSGDFYGTDYGLGIAVDGSGNASVTGWTQSSNFPTTANAFQTQHPDFASPAAFVSKLDASGSALLYSTYFGGSQTRFAGPVTVGRGIAVDGTGNVYITGGTSCTDLPMKNALQPQFAGYEYDAFVAKFNPGLSGSDSLVYSTYLGGKGIDNQMGQHGAIAVDALGNAYVTGTNYGGDFPVKNAFSGTYLGGSPDAFVAKLSTDGSRLIYSSYLNSTGADHGRAIAVDATGNAYVAGYTNSPNFPTTPGTFKQGSPSSTKNNNNYDVFLTKIANPPAAGPGLDVIMSATTTAGAVLSFTIAAMDPVGNTLTGFTGTIHLTSSDPQVVLPADYTFTAEDQGVHTFSVTLTTAGTWSLSAAATDMLGGQTSIQVKPAAATHLVISGPTSTKANVGFSITVKAYDDYGNVATGYRGTVRFTSSDATAILPANYIFTAGDNGVHTFTGLKLKTKGRQTISAIDTLFASLSGALTTDVT